MHFNAFIISILSLSGLAESGTAVNPQVIEKPHARSLSTAELVDSPGLVVRAGVVDVTRCRGVGSKIVNVHRTDAEIVRIRPTQNQTIYSYADFSQVGSV
ncbi:hypothetical protein AC579_2528 [Pseudocercospora musae]|uniref:Uncharacterized protein n=1 Tax=Pseudocercospora musae TaxID=113226 RepID=A0A139I3V6_9PEZI|nr:hypothetical protein AC579_2528 [Pseudocercospora musae]